MARPDLVFLFLEQFSPEREVWLQPMELEVDYPFMGASPLFPNVSCRRDRTVCIVTTGEAEINAASTSAPSDSLSLHM